MVTLLCCAVSAAVTSENSTEATSAVTMAAPSASHSAEFLRAVEQRAKTLEAAKAQLAATEILEEGEINEDLESPVTRGINAHIDEELAKSVERMKSEASAAPTSDEKHAAPSANVSITEAPPLPEPKKPDTRKVCAARFFIGIDWSHNSPAVAIMTPQGYLKLGALHRTAECKGRVESSVDFESAEGKGRGRLYCNLFAIPDYEKLEMSKLDPRGRFLKTRFNIQTMVNFIVDTIKQATFELDNTWPDRKFEHMRLEIAVEDYAYGAVKQTPTTLTMLAEDAGALKLAIFSACGVAPEPMGITHIKKSWTGSGSANKKDMCTFWKVRGLPPMNLPCCVIQDPKYALQSPYNDLVDATAIVFTKMQELGVEFVTKFAEMDDAGWEAWKAKMIDVGDVYMRVVKKDDA